jgi:hypothetical protein
MVGGPRFVEEHMVMLGSAAAMCVGFSSVGLAKRSSAQLILNLDDCAANRIRPVSKEIHFSNMHRRNEPSNGQQYVDGGKEWPMVTERARETTQSIPLLSPFQDALDPRPTRFLEHITAEVNISCR